MDVFTSISLNYLPKACVLAESLKKFHPDWAFHLLISDRLPAEGADNIQTELSNARFDKVIWIDQLDIPNRYSWIFKHTVVELCTAVKGPYLQHLVKAGAKKIMYIDPDIAVFNDLHQLDELLDKHSILLTPHLLDASDNLNAINENEIDGTMRHGIFNLGFLAINPSRADGKRFSEWWGHRLLNFCYADYDRGLFTDQKWCDHAPALFEDLYILRDPGYNVASWNLNKRRLSLSESGQILVNDVYPLRFYHFTGYDSGSGDFMTQRYSSQNKLVDEIWAWYARAIKRMSQDRWGSQACFYNFYSNGTKITLEDRKFYRNRSDLQEAYPNPFNVRDDLIRSIREKAQ
jgi:lipopolysaccharide biosynthesis glycosyltransferase